MYTGLSVAETQTNTSRSIKDCNGKKASEVADACLKPAAVEAGNKGYTVESESTSGDTFTIERNSEGEVTRSCVQAAGSKGCATGKLVIGF